MSSLKMVVTLSIATVALTTMTGSAHAGAVSEKAAATAAVRHGPLLGSKNYWDGDDDRGFGVAHPKRFYNGGDPSGLVFHITWDNWGARRAHGHGLNYTFKPGGGYYRKPVRAKLRAIDLGHCTPNSRTAYQHLNVRIQRKPGGEFGRWFSWSGPDRIC